jgi:hypothetical protein
MQTLSKVASLHAERIYANVQRERFGINSCKNNDYEEYRHLLKIAEYYEINKEQDKIAVSSFGETIYKYQLNQEIENSYCPAVNKLINSL